MKNIKYQLDYLAMSMYKLDMSCNTTNNIHNTGKGGEKKNYSKEREK